MNKAYARIEWKNYPNRTTPLNEGNLNRMDASLNVVDDRVVAMDTTKANKIDLAQCFTNCEYDKNTGKIKFTRQNGVYVEIDTELEKLAVNFDYNPTTQKLIILLNDGTQKELDLSSLISQFEIKDTETIHIVADAQGVVSANVINGSITREKLSPDYLAEIDAKVTEATHQAEISTDASVTAVDNAKLAQSYAIGGSGARTGEDTDNSKYYSEQSKASEQISTTNAATTTSDVAKTKQNADNALASENEARSYAIGNNNSSKYYYEQTKIIAESITSGGLVPFGTVSFDNLPSLAEASVGALYNISDEFITTDDFVEGSGNTIPMGSNVYKTTDGKWDVLAGSPVTGVKGESQVNYARGNVSLSANDVGAIPENKLGNSDITSIGDGTLTGAISQLNTNLAESRSYVGMIIHSTIFDTMDKVIAFYGGTQWNKIEGRFLLGQSSNYPINSMGGEATHSLTINEMPAHSHTTMSNDVQGNDPYGYTNPYNGLKRSLNKSYIQYDNTSSVGEGQAFNNMPPYKTVYIWERVA